MLSSLGSMGRRLITSAKWAWPYAITCPHRQLQTMFCAGLPWPGAGNCCSVQCNSLHGNLGQASHTALPWHLSGHRHSQSWHGVHTCADVWTISGTSIHVHVLSVLTQTIRLIPTDDVYNPQSNSPTAVFSLLRGLQTFAHTHPTLMQAATPLLYASQTSEQVSVDWAISTVSWTCSPSLSLPASTPSLNP